MFGLGEILFGKLVSVSKSLLDLKQTRQGDDPLHLEDVGLRLEYLASFLSKTRISIRAAESVGGYRGDTLLLPSTINLQWPKNTKEVDALNYSAYRFRVAYSLASRQRGVASAPTDRWMDYLSTAIEVIPTLRLAFQQWPSACLQFMASRVGTETLDPLDRPFLLDLLQLNPEGGGTELVNTLLELESYRAQRGTVDRCRDLEWIQTQIKSPRRMFSSSPLIGKLLPALEQRDTCTEPADDPKSSPTRRQETPSTLIETGPRDYVRELDAPKTPEQENPVVHNFEKVQTVDRFSGSQRRTCGDDELQDHKQGLDEIDLRDIVRTHQSTGSVYRSNIMRDPRTAQVQVPGVQEFSYDEWEHRSSKYRPNYCIGQEVLLPTLPPRAATLEWASRIARRHRRHIAHLRSAVNASRDSLRSVPRQSDGEAIDIDALVQHQADLLAGESFKSNFYIQKRRACPHVSNLLLLDLSHSSDAYINGVRVLDSIKESAVIVAKALEPMRFPFEVAAFNSHTHRNCRYQILKEAEAPWASLWEQICQLTPEGYTRIGAAIRHATNRLKTRPARRKNLILMSDAKPTDYDGYEGAHGEQDVRKAIAECRAQRIDHYAIILSSTRHRHHVQMFGRHGCGVATTPADATEQLGKLIRLQIRR